MKHSNRRERRIWLGLTAVLLCAIVLLAFSPRVLARDGKADTERLLGIFYEILRFVEENYVDEVDAEALIEGALQGLFQALDDPYSTYLTADDMADMNDTTLGRFGGVGLLISKVEEGVQVVSPIEDTPAYKVGVHAGDIIVAIEGESVLDWTIDEVVDVLRGEPGTPVQVTIQRGKSINFSVEIVRAMIEVPTAKWDMLPGKIAYLRITNFTPLTPQKVAEALHFFERNRYGGLIIDVRSNPGGLLSSVVDVVDLILSSGPIVSTRGRNPDQDYVYNAAKRGTIVSEEIPIIVMINRGSASASEILAGALQDTSRARTVGEKSYGKGSVQQIKRIGEAGFKLTMSRYYTPLGKNIDKVGIIPDVEILEPELTEKEEEALSRIFEDNLIREFVEQHQDPTEAQIRALMQDLADQNLGLQERFIRRMVRNEVNRTNDNPPVYDLEYDIVLKKSLELLE